MSKIGIRRRDILKGMGALGILSANTIFTRVAATESKEDLTEWVGFSICDNCNQVPACGVKFTAKGNVIQSIENWEQNPNHVLCSKGLSTLQRLYNPNRLLYPMKRTNPKGSPDPGFVRCSWEEAYRLIAGNLTRVKAKDGADAVMFYCGDPKEPRPAVMRLARYFGTVHWASESSVGCRAACMQAEQLTWGRPSQGTMPGPKTKTFLVLATNVWSRPLGWWKTLMEAKRRGCKIIVIDTRNTKTAQFADIHLAPRIGTDAALAMGIIRTLIKENLYDKDFVSNWCYGFEELKAYAEDFTPEKTEEITGVPADLIVKAARMYAEGPGSFALTSQSLTHNSNGVNNARALLLIPCILGYIDVPGGVMFPSVPKGQQACGMGLQPKFYDAKWFNAKAQKSRRADREFVPVWNDMMIPFNPNQLPELIKTGKIKAFGGWGFNVMIWPQFSEYAKAMENLEFAFAADYFYRKESHSFMDVILPAAMNFERYAPFGSYGSKYAVRLPVKPLGEAKEDWKIALELGSILDDPKNFFDGDPIKACNSILKEWGGKYEEAQVRLPEISTLDAEKNEPKKYEKGRLRPDGKPGFNTPTGKIELFSTRTAKFGFDGLPVYKPMMKPDKRFNLRLLNGSRKPFITHSKTRSDSPYLLELEEHSTIHMNPHDAQERNIKDGDWVEIRSPYGGPAKALVEISILVPPGTVDSQYGWRGEEDTQHLIPRQWDPISGYAPYFEVNVEVKKSGD